MKLFKKYFVTVALVVAMLTTCVAIFGGAGQNAQALSPDYTGMPNTIYYFYDFYPTFNQEKLTDEFGAYYHIVYDHGMVGQQSFTTLVNSGYFADFGSNCTVIIDIKAFVPLSATLYNLFWNLKEEQACQTVFVTTCLETDFSDTSFLEYVDAFIDDAGFDELDAFFTNSLEHFESNSLAENEPSDPDHFNGTAFMLDSWVVNIEAYTNAESNPELEYPDLDGLCAASLFLKHFVERLADRLNLSYSCYEEVADYLRSVDIRILVYYPNRNGFVDILTWTFVPLTDAFDSFGDASHVCALGFWAFTPNFYQTLYDYQIVQGYKELLIYALIIDPLTNDPDGLGIVADHSLSSGDFATQQRLMQALHNLLG